MKKETYHSSSNTFDKKSALKSAYHNINRANHTYNIIDIQYDKNYCEICRDYHIDCSITIELKSDAPSDLAIKLQEALKQA